MVISSSHFWVVTCQWKGENRRNSKYGRKIMLKSIGIMIFYIHTKKLLFAPNLAFLRRIKTWTIIDSLNIWQSIVDDCIQVQNLKLTCWLALAQIRTVKYLVETSRLEKLKSAMKSDPCHLIKIVFKSWKLVKDYCQHQKFWCPNQWIKWIWKKLKQIWCS